MNYIEQVEHGRGLVSAETVIPADVFAYALSLKQPEALARRATPEDLRVMPEATRQFKKARTIGNASVRLAIGSYLAHEHGADVAFLGDLPDKVREEVLDEFFQDYDGKISVTDTEIARRLFATKRAMLSHGDRLREMKSYVNTRPGAYLKSHESTGFGMNDALYAQAFGRNSYTDAEMPEFVVGPRGTFETDEAMFAYLDAVGFDEGDSNRALAEVPVELLQNPDKLIEMIMQWEVTYPIWKHYPEIYAKYNEGIHTVWPKSKFYPTFDVKDDSIEVARRHGLYNPLELAAEVMAVRGLGILTKRGVAADVVPVDAPFDQDSTQAQTQNIRNWRRRERLTRVHHILTNQVRF